MTFDVLVEVRLRDGIADPQGATIERRLPTLGYDAVMLAGKRPHLSPLDATPDHLAPVQQALARTGLRCEVIAGYTDFAGWSAAEVPYGEMQVAYVEALAGYQVGSRLS